MSYEMQPFFDAMMEKFQHRSTIECHKCGGKGETLHHLDSTTDLRKKCNRCLGTGRENRSLRPWKDFDWKFLVDRLKDEIDEFHAAHYVVEIKPGMFQPRRDFRVPISDEAAAELLDIANFAGFLWIKWKALKEVHDAFAAVTAAEDKLIAYRKEKEDLPPIAVSDVLLTPGDISDSAFRELHDRINAQKEDE